MWGVAVGRGLKNSRRWRGTGASGGLAAGGADGRGRGWGSLLRGSAAAAALADGGGHSRVRRDARKVEQSIGRRRLHDTDKARTVPGGVRGNVNSMSTFRGGARAGAVATAAAAAAARLLAGVARLTIRTVAATLIIGAGAMVWSPS